MVPILVRMLTAPRKDRIFSLWGTSGAGDGLVERQAYTIVGDVLQEIMRQQRLCGDRLVHEERELSILSPTMILVFSNY